IYLSILVQTAENLSVLSIRPAPITTLFPYTTLFRSQENWTTPEKAIEGGAKWIAENYIRSATHQQDTLYKMRWNPAAIARLDSRSEEHTSELQSRENLVCRLLLEKKNKKNKIT